MDEQNQVPPAQGEPEAPPQDPASILAWLEPYGAPDFAAIEAVERRRRVSRGLLAWLAIVLATGVPAVALGLPELALLTAFGGLFAASHASDLDRSWEFLDRALGWVVPIGGALLFVGLAAAYAKLGGLSSVAWRIEALCIAGVAGSLLMLSPAVSTLVAGAFFRTSEPSRTLRLSAAVALIAFLLAPPCMLAAPRLLEVLVGEGRSLVDNSSLGGGLAGEIVLALGAVGFLVRRDLRATLRRLGLRPLAPRHILLVGLGVAALFAINAGMDALERVAFPALYARDQSVNRAIAGGLSGAQALLLGLSAGVGEEITVRGALQPRFGLLPSALLFAALHVQYSWFGILLVFALGVTLGVIRARTSTTAAIAVHAVYDALAVFGT